MKISFVNFKSILPDLKKITSAIVKSVGIDTKEYILSNNNETNNAIKFIRGDIINTNLRNMVVSETMELHPFHRHSYEGRLLIDHKNKCTYTICTRKTLLSIPKKRDRKVPHYLQSILHIQNDAVNAEYVQLTLLDDKPYEDFSDDFYFEDYKEIMGNNFIFDKDYTHIVIAYESEHYRVTYLVAEVLTSNFSIGQSYDMMELIQPDFIDLTAESENEPIKNGAHNLVAVKQSLINAKMPKQESLVSAKKEGVNKQA